MRKWEKAIIILAMLLISVGTMYLFYQQAIDNFDGDLHSHVESAIESTGMEGQYSITKILYKFIYNYLGGNLGISIMLSLVTIGCIYATKRMLKFYLPDENDFKLYIWAILLNFVIAIHIAAISKNWNVGYQEPTEWHNSTYLIMKFIGIFIMMLYFSIEKNYLEKINIKQWGLFCVLLILINLVKPNFILAFAPAMLVFLIIDFCKNIKNKKAILNMIYFGSAVLISLSVLIYQAKVLYVDDTESGLAISFMEILKIYTNHPYCSLLQSAAFPLFILITNFKTIIKDKRHSFVWIMGIVSLLQYLLFMETGSRHSDGNFDWGYSFSLMLLFISSYAILNKIWTEKSKNKVYLVSAYTLLMLHVISGVIYFCRLLTGIPFD